MEKLILRQIGLLIMIDIIIIIGAEQVSLGLCDSVLCEKCFFVQLEVA